jgi:hypothetical protein
MHRLERLRLLLPALWAGGLMALALVGTPAPFATLAASDAGRVVARILTQEAYASLVFGMALLLLERRAARQAGAGAAKAEGSQFSAGFALALAAIFCTVLGHFAVQPLMPAARSGQGAFTFAQLHAASVACYIVKTVLVLALAWRNAGAALRPPSFRRPSS